MSSIQFHCPHCQLALNVPERRGGTSVRCPGCKQTVAVPAQSQPLTASTPPPPAQVLSPSPTSPPVPAAHAPPPIDLAAATPPLPTAAPPAEQGSSATLSQPAPGDEERLEQLGRHHRISLHRSVIYGQGILLIVVAVLAFLVGLAMSGGGTSSQDSGQRERARLEGRIRFAEGEFGTPDRGAVVIVLPREKQPSERFPIHTLTPDTVMPGDNDPTVQEIRRLGGDYVRTGHNGQFHMKVDKGVPYFLLAISHDRPRSDEVHPDILDELERYFTNGSQLLGQQSFRWQVEVVEQSKRVEIMFP